MYGTEQPTKRDAQRAAIAIPERLFLCEIKRATSGDIAGIVQLERSRSDILTPPSDRPQKGSVVALHFADKLEALIRNPSDLVLVAKSTSGNRVVGAMIVYGQETAARAYPYLAPYLRDGSKCFIDGIVVDRENEGRGTSTRLLREFRSWAAEKKMSDTLTEVCTYPHNGPALALIHGTGMRKVAMFSDEDNKTMWGLFSAKINQEQSEILPVAPVDYVRQEIARRATRPFPD